MSRINTIFSPIVTADNMTGIHAKTLSRFASANPADTNSGRHVPTGHAFTFLIPDRFQREPNFDLQRFLCIYP
jgi:hypothetical protein